jgi:hypothetical protein
MRLGISTSGACLLAVGWFLLMPITSFAQPTGAAAKCISVAGALLTSAAKGAWTSVPVGDVPVDKLLVAFFGAQFQSPDGGVEAKVVADIGQRGPFPVLEAAVRFHAPKDADLDISLDRGILVLTNTKKSGAARVRVHMRSEIFEITLHEPKAKLGIEVYGRHTPGPAKLKDIKDDDPIANIAFFALLGEVVINTKTNATRLQAPPGAAMYLWDNVTRTGEVVRFDVLPDSVKPMSADERKQFDAICRIGKAWAADASNLGKRLEQSADKGDPMERKAAVVAFGALDDLPRLMQILGNKDHADTREMAIIVIRHWLGREPGQSIRLYHYLTKNENNTPTQAKNILHLLNGIAVEKRRQPQTYDLLILALNHSKLLARELAHWHLVRLVPEGKSIEYDAAGTEMQRQEAIAAWRRLIPEGELPQVPKSKSTSKIRN